MLNNPETNISDEEALTIWGKYVPVVLYAQKNGYATQVNSFRACQNNALALKTAAHRNAARKACYDALASMLGNTMNNSSEFVFMASYNISDNRWNTDNLSGEFGLTAITRILNQKLQDNRNLLASKQSMYNTKATQYNTAINGNATLQSKTNLYNKSVTDKTLLQSQISQKQPIYNNLDNEIN